jgi:hypothetical protein
MECLCKLTHIAFPGLRSGKGAGAKKKNFLDCYVTTYWLSLGHVRGLLLGTLKDIEKHMPAWYKIDKEHNLVLSTGSGVVTLADLLEHQKRLGEDPEYDPAYSQLFDFTHVNKLELSAADIPIIAQGVTFLPSARRAILVGTDEAQEYSELYRSLRETMGDRGIRTFRTLDEALDWLVRKI